MTRAILPEAMPIYEYKCNKRHTFEVRQGFTDDPVTTCEVCGAPVKRVFHPVAVHFKGKGFYSTDYGSRNRSRELKEAAEGKSSKDSGSSGDSGSSSDSGSSGDSGSSSSDKSSDGGSKSDSKTSSTPAKTKAAAD
jgi:putative FmdB family regulatory protein